MKSVVCRFIVLMGLFVGLCAPLLASTICVTVVDPSTLPIPSPPGAHVRIVDLSNPDFMVSMVTDREGKACSEDLPVGLYYVEVNCGGFLNVRYYPIRVDPTEDVRLRVPLQIWQSAVIND